MESYSKKNIRIAEIITILSLFSGFVGEWLTHNYRFLNAAFIPMGISAIVFSHDLTMNRVIRYNADYKVCRGMFIVVGIAFIVIGIVTVVKS